MKEDDRIYCNIVLFLRKTTYIKNKQERCVLLYRKKI